MKKIFTCTFILLLVLSGCAKSKNNPSAQNSDLEVNTVNFFTEVAKDNDSKLFLSSRYNGHRAEVLNDYYATVGYGSNKFVSSASYLIYNDDADLLLKVSIFEYTKKFDEDDIYTTSCMIDNTVIQYYIFDDIDEDDLMDDFEDFCEDNDGEFFESSHDWNYEDDDYDDYDDDDYDDDDDDVEFKY